MILNIFFAYFITFFKQKISDVSAIIEWPCSRDVHSCVTADQVGKLVHTKNQRVDPYNPPHTTYEQRSRMPAACHLQPDSQHDSCAAVTQE